MFQITIMAKVNLILVCFLISHSHVFADTIIFEDVTLYGYEIFVPKFKQHIVSSYSLKENIPEGVSYDALEISNGIIPILYVDSVSDLKDLDELILVNDGITEIHPGTFKNLPIIRKINLKKNKLKEIKAGVFNGLPIADLDLSENLLESIDEDAFDNLPNLLSINLGQNKLTEWRTEWFKENPSIIRISFHHNLLETLPVGAFQNLVGDKHSDAARSSLYLNFGYNHIKQLPSGVFDGLSKIKYLWLDGNRIRSIEEGFLDGVEVNNLLLNDNEIKCITSDFDKTLPADIISLDGNPWNCTCLEELKEWKKKSGKTVATSYAEMECNVERLAYRVDRLDKVARRYKVDDILGKW